MNTSGYHHIPRELFHWITFLSKALPSRSIATFIELAIGAMLTSAGFVTHTYLMIDMSRHWTSYYKWLQRGRWSWLALARQFVRLALEVINDKVVYLAIDDNCEPRRKYQQVKFIISMAINLTWLVMSGGSAGLV